MDLLLNPHEFVALLNSLVFMGILIELCLQAIRVVWLFSNSATLFVHSNRLFLWPVDIIIIAVHTCI